MRQAGKKTMPAGRSTDEQIARRCVKALNNAYQRALAENAAVVVSDEMPDGRTGLYEVSSDGGRRLLKVLGRRPSVPAGTRVRIR